MSLRMKSGLTWIGVATLLAACGGGGGGGGGGGSSSTTPPAMGFVVTALVADTSTVQSEDEATYTDPNLKNPWGIALDPQGYVWVANNVTSTSTIYSGAGVATAPYTGGPLAIDIAKGSDGTADPTGIVYNSSISGNSGSFVLPDGAPASFIYATLGGTIEGWDTASAGSTVIEYDGGASGAVYTGLALGADSTGNFFLYAADFSNGTVDVFDHGFNKITPAGGFTMPTGVPAGFAPYGIQNIAASGGTTQIYVSYAQQNAAKNAAVPGAGAGYVAVFDADGNFIKLLISGGSLNAPWGMALAPSSFGGVGGALLVGNFGDGKINAYNASTGVLTGALVGSSGSPVVISGLWGIAFGNGANGLSTTTLYFTAGANNEADGVYGTVTYGSSSTGGGGGGGGY